MVGDIYGLGSGIVSYLFLVKANLNLVSLLCEGREDKHQFN